MNNNRGSDPSDQKPFLVPRRPVPAAAALRDRRRLQAIAENALLPLALVFLAIGIFAPFGRNRWAEIKSLLTPALPSITAFLGAAAGSRSWFRR